MPLIQQGLTEAPPLGGLADSKKIKSHHVAGVLVPVFAIRSASDLGIGDVRGVRKAIDWLSEMGMSFLQILPINETGRDNSPYNAVSSVAIDFTTLDVSPEGLPDLTRGQYDEVTAGADLDRLRSGPINYPIVKKLKIDVLWSAFENFWHHHYHRESQRDREFHRFCARERNWLGDYCLYHLLMDMEGGNEVWSEWQEDYNEIAKARSFAELLLDLNRERTEKQLAFYAYVQWVADSQWKEARDYAALKRIELMGDMPFGVSYYSADVFCNPELFDLEWSGGAPPETNFKDDAFTQQWGQNWGIPLYRWDVMELKGFTWWKARIARLASIFSAFRIDHALGFYRIYSFPWRPERNGEFLGINEFEASAKTNHRLPRFWERADDTGEHRAKNRAAGEKILRIVKEAAGESDIIAEDLGLVPDYVEASLESLAIPGMKVPQWQDSEEGGGPKMGKEYPFLSMATYATHDHEPLKTQWENLRKAAKGLSNGESDAEEAKRALRHLAEFAGIGGDPVETEYSDATREAFLEALFASESKYTSVMVSDLLGIEQRFNIPGVVTEGNWTTRMECTVEELVSDPKWKALTARTREMLEETDRLMP